MPLKSSQLAKPTTIIDCEIMLNEKIPNAGKLVEVTQEGIFIIIKSKQFLDNPTWRDLCVAVNQLGGTWVGDGKNSHWEIVTDGTTKPMKKCGRCGNQSLSLEDYEGKNLCPPCLKDIKSSLEQPIPKTNDLVKNVNDRLTEAKQSIKNSDNKKPISFQPFQMLSVDKILCMPQQIRRQETDLTELIESIREKGILEPILVRPKESGNFELVFGSRRLAAAKKADLKEIPCLVKPLSDEEAYELQLIENVQRTDVSDIEIAHWLDRLLKKYPQKYPTQESLAKRVSKSQTWISRHLSMLESDNFMPRGIISKPEVITEGLTRELRNVPEEKQEEVTQFVTEHIEKEGKPPSISKIHELAHPQESTQPTEPSSFGTESELSYKEPRNEIQAESSIPLSKQIEIGSFECTECKKTFRVIHVANNLHRLKEVIKA